MVILGADLALVDAFVRRSDVLYDQTPLVHPLVVVDADTSVRCERIEPDCQRMNLVEPFPCYLYRQRSNLNELQQLLLNA